jgi:L-fuculose-phosphate aldolase
MPSTKDREKRQSIIDACLRMNGLGINQGTSGNISLRHGDGLLITRTSTPCEAMQPEQIVYMHLGLPKEEIEKIRVRMAGYGHADA